MSKRRAKTAYLCRDCGKTVVIQYAKKSYIDRKKCKNCFRKWQRQRNNKHRKRVKHCKVCGDQITNPNYSSYCDANCAKIGKKIVDKKWKEKNKENLINYYQIYRNECLKIIGSRCIFCGQEDIHFHHVIPVLSQERKYRHPKWCLEWKDMIIPLCSQCHTMWHLVKEWLELIVM